ncbi:hypothetical protein CLV92_11665 [Kineococcus xinjiangensis]|uniref:Uncharacterized protein n=1 Tax=Kineococcus xinjiangensis TaxID=512762 RepID=A0A2S6IDF4_9ACTN|nr:hypothetical protein CLV92_11665 [Kineococcus xinjiangensis]
MTAVRELQGRPEELSLSSFGTDPVFAAAQRSCPPLWRNCLLAEYDDVADPSELDIAVEELLPLAWIARAGTGWALSVADAWKAFVDLRLDEEEDPAIDVLRGHPGVIEARHEHTEVYSWTTRAAMTPAEAAALGLRALAAGHRHAAAAAGIADDDEDA